MTPSLEKGRRTPGPVSLGPVTFGSVRAGSRGQADSRIDSA